MADTDLTGTPANETSPPDAAAPVEPLPEAAAAPKAARPTLPELGASDRAQAQKHLGLLLDVGVEVAAVVGRRQLTLEQLIAVGPGTVVDLERDTGAPIELQVNGKTIATAEIVVLDGKLGARILEVVDV